MPTSATDADTIDFSVAGKIQLYERALPAITDTVNIDGRSVGQDLRSVRSVEIDGNGFAGLSFDAGSAKLWSPFLSIVNADGAWCNPQRFEHRCRRQLHWPRHSTDLLRQPTLAMGLLSIRLPRPISSAARSCWIAMSYRPIPATVSA